MGPAGSGKSTYCSAMQRHAEVLRRQVHVVNLDPAAEHFDYTPSIDVRDLVHLDDVMEDEQLRFGPNGGLVFCMEYLLENIGWLEEQLGDDDDDYFLFDCPGQIELYSHLNVMKRLVDTLQALNFRLCGVFLLDACFLIDHSKFISGTMAALGVMVNLNTPHVNVITKTDLLDAQSRRNLDRFIDPDMTGLLADEAEVDESDAHAAFTARYRRLTAAIASVVEQFGLVHYHALNIQSEDSLNELTAVLDNCIQYGEDSDVRIAEFEQPDLDEDAEESVQIPDSVQQLSNFLKQQQL